MRCPYHLILIHLEHPFPPHKSDRNPLPLLPQAKRSGWSIFGYHYPLRLVNFGLSQPNFFPLSNKTFTSTARCSIKRPLSERVTIGNGGQTNQPLVALFLYDQISLIKTLSHTKHRDKKIPPSVNLMCGATPGSECERNHSQPNQNRGTKDSWTCSPFL